MTLFNLSRFIDCMNKLRTLTLLLKLQQSENMESDANMDQIYAVSAFTNRQQDWTLPTDLKIERKHETLHS